MDKENLNPGLLSKASDLRQRVIFTILILSVYRLGTYVPLPGIDPIRLHFPLHLIPQGWPVRFVLLPIPVVIRSAIPLTQDTLAPSKFVELLLTFGHEPTGQHTAPPITPFQDLACLILVNLPTRDTRDHRHVRITVEEDLLYEVLETIVLGIVAQFYPDVFQELRTPTSN